MLAMPSYLKAKTLEKGHKLGKTKMILEGNHNQNSFSDLDSPPTYDEYLDEDDKWLFIVTSTIPQPLVDSHKPHICFTKNHSPWKKISV